MRTVEAGLSFGKGVGAILYDASQDDRVLVDAIDARNVPEGWIEEGLAMHRDPSRTADYILHYRAKLT